MEFRKLSVGLGLFSIALGAAELLAPRNKAVWGALAFVVGATILDALTASGLDRQTGKTRPAREHAPA